MTEPNAADHLGAMVQPLELLMIGGAALGAFVVGNPAKTLKAGGNGVRGGVNMLRHNNGRIRYLSIRESARLQTFPDDYELHGAWGEAMRQLGNAVPVMLGKVVAASVKDALDSESDRIDLRRSMETAK